MAGEKADVLLLGPKKSLMVDALSGPFNLHIAADAKDFDAFTTELAPRIRAIAISATTEKAPATFPPLAATVTGGTCSAKNGASP